MNFKRILSILLLVVSIAMIGSGVYIMNSSKYIFETALKGVFDYAVDGYTEMTDSLDDFDEYKKYKLTTANSLTMLGEEYASINGNVYVNATDEKVYLNLDSKFAGEEFIGMEALLSENKMYAMIKEAMDDFYYVDLDTSSAIEIEELEEYDFSQLLKLEEDELELLVKHLEDSILKDIKDKDIVKGSKTIKLDGKDHKTTKVSLNISEKIAGQIVENLLTSISKDNKAIQVLQKIDRSITKNSIQEWLNTFKEQSSSLSSEAEFSISFYVEGFGSLRRIEFAAISSEADSVANDSAITVDIYDNTHKNKTYLLTALSGEQEIFTLKEEYISDSEANLFIKASDMEISGTIKEAKNSVTLNLNLISEGQTLGTIDYKYTVVSEDKEYKMEIGIEISNMMSITSTNTLLINEEIPEVDVDGAMSFDEMTQEDQQAITDYIEEKLESLGLSDGDDDYYDDSYSDDDYSWDDENSD